MTPPPAGIRELRQARFSKITTRTRQVYSEIRRGMKLGRMALAAPLIMIVIVTALFLCWWEYWPGDDPDTQEECVESHDELTSIDSNGMPHFDTVCDKSRLKQCVRWKQERTWAGKSYKACVEYE